MTLSQTAVLTKQVITISAISLVLGIVSFIGYKIWYAYYLASLPPVEEKPDIKFGQLPMVELPKGTVSPSNFSYSIDTATGNLPVAGQDPGFEKITKVYFVTKTFATLLSSEKTKSLAEKFDINNPPQILSETNYSFKEDGKTLNVDLDSGNFIYNNDATISAKESLDEDNKLVADFKRSLQTLGVFKDDLQNGQSKVLRLKNADWDIAQISLWPAAIDNKPVLTAQYDTSLVYAKVYGSAGSLQNYTQLNFTYYPIDTSTFATYPIQSPQKALEDLKNGKGVIMIEPNLPQVSITSVSLGYFLAENYSPYLQPIFVFEGPHFVAYAPAISPESPGVNEQSQPQAR